MFYTFNNIDYEIILEKKKIKNLYIRVKPNNKIHITTRSSLSEKDIRKLLDENTRALQKMINHVEKEEQKKDKFFYLGNSYDIIIDDDINRVIVTDTIIYTKDLKMLDRWYKEEAIRVFDDRYVYVFNHFNENIKSPILKIRDMKSRWGVYNRKNHTITLNLKLIGYSIDKIDYVIIHELSHIMHFDHSKEFWNLVSKYCSDYKAIRKDLRE